MIGKINVIAVIMNCRNVYNRILVYVAVSSQVPMSPVILILASTKIVEKLLLNITEIESIVPPNLPDFPSFAFL